MSRSLLEKKEIKKNNRDEASAYEKSGTSVVLMEIIIAILLFMVVGSVCVQLFVKSYKTTQTSTILQNASVISSGVADMIVQTNGDLGEVCEYYPNSTLADDYMEIYYDSSFKNCQKDGSVYTLVVSGDANELETFEFNMMFEGQSVYDMSVKVASYVK